ncbi:unnamed protein product [Paramecium sonneborni]|uniref:non-specific serine/threonine protein kinase n=1 Tax=Paramecium sonneborni TaxID=65129 RepID=A0A8S1LB09_9CILI|nr:unnamed protein product [Paramecium sonneborni]
MGNCNNTHDLNVDEIKLPNKCNYNFQYIIGRGGFGKVWRAEHKKTKHQYAIKEMQKCKIINKKSIGSVMNERYLLSNLRHPFLVNMHTAFQDRESLYLVMDLMTGGDLRFHICKNRKFSEEQTSKKTYFLQQEFFVICVLLALEYLHHNTVIHRDIKPENLVFDKNGYLRLTDLGIARIWKPGNDGDTSGTPGYMAPEVMCRQVHGVASDYFAVGILTYECMMGKRPYIGKTRKEIRDQILSKQITIKSNSIPGDLSEEAADFINQMIQRKPVNRLGFYGPDEVFAHPWFQNVDWDAYFTQSKQAPYKINSNSDNFDQKFANIKDPEEDAQAKLNAELLKRNSIQEAFYGYTYKSQNSQQQTIQDQTNSKPTTSMSQQITPTKKKLLDSEPQNELKSQKKYNLVQTQKINKKINFTSNPPLSEKGKTKTNFDF